MKKILLINPQSPDNFWTLNGLCRLIHKSALMPPLALATVSALTPPDYEVTIVDEAVTSIDYDVPCNLVGVTGYTIHQERMATIAAEFRKRGVFTVGGGPYCSSHPEDSQRMFDVVIVGEADRVWPEFLQDWAQGAPRALYEEPEKLDIQTQPLPRWDSVRLDRYGVGIVQTSRGCPYDCEFCDVVALLGRQMRYKTVEQVAAEITQLVQRGILEIFFADDNFIGNSAYAKQLLRRLIELNQTFRYPLRYTTQVTINLAQDDELLDLFKRANFHGLFVGIETPRKASLESANKRQNLKDDVKEAVRKVQSRGIILIPGMIVGFDTDDLAIFEEQRVFLQEAGLLLPMMGILMAPKGTKLWRRLEQEGRLLPFEYGNNFFLTNIIPKQMSKLELETRYLSLLQTVYTPEHFINAYRAFLAQVDLNEIRHDSAVSRMIGIRTSHISYLLSGVYVIKHYLWGNARLRRLFWTILRMTVKKNVQCIPLALYSLVHFASHYEFITKRLPAPL